MSCTVACECVSGYVRAKVRAWAYANIGYTPVCILFRACASMCACASVCVHVCMYAWGMQCSRLHAYEHVIHVHVSVSACTVSCIRAFMSDTEFDMVQRVCMPVVFPI